MQERLATGLAYLPITLCLLFFYPFVAGADAGTGSDQVLDKPPTSGRLRFRSGPVCLCSNGLGEADIQAAEQKQQNSKEQRPAEDGRQK
ncbi:MAG: hypothetical protein KDJ38_14250 [Gammaproteobacteria bacterium]|nr:hypothetical protein [Gammaproteobacteria bacterium]